MAASATCPHAFSFHSAHRGTRGRRGDWGGARRRTALNAMATRQAGSGCTGERPGHVTAPPGSGRAPVRCVCGLAWAVGSVRAVGMRGGCQVAVVERAGLGGFLRARRERVDPRAVGVVSSSRRRTPGLRREDVARRADVSVEWYTRLEQGRGGTPSAQVLRRVADALLLDPVEREHLFLLAHGQPYGPPGAAPADGVSARLRGVLDAMPHSPAYVKTAAWDVVAWNRAARLVLSDYEAMDAEERNVLKILFLDPTSRTSLRDWEWEAGLAVSTFRRELTRWGTGADTGTGTGTGAGAGDPAARLVRELRARSADFARLWDANGVGLLGEGVKHLTHPVAGELALWYSSFAVDDAPGLGMVVYTPDSARDARRVRDLLARDDG
ncbi:helix-turn-helix transcriptional regulator [Streptomyces sp. NPDC054784]